jgi:hypothetical protein
VAFASVSSSPSQSGLSGEERANSDRAASEPKPEPRSALVRRRRGCITFGCSVSVSVNFQTSDHDVLLYVLRVVILCRASEWQLSSLEQVCNSSLPPLSMLEDLYINKDSYFPPHWQDYVENALWLDLLRSFVALKNLYLSEEFVPRIAPALQELVGGRTTEVLPCLENILLEGFQPSGPLQEGIEKFVAARRLTSHPIVVSPLDRERDLEIFG